MTTRLVRDVGTSARFYRSSASLQKDDEGDDSVFLKGVNFAVTKSNRIWFPRKEETSRYKVGTTTPLRQRKGRPSEANP